jgi:hypothetical protein
MKFNLNFPSHEWQSIIKGTFIALAGAVLTVISQNIAGFAFGPYTPFVVALLSILVNILRKALTQPTTVIAEEDDDPSTPV